MNSITYSWIIIFQREIISYFSTTIAYVFIAIFLILSSLFTFYLGNFFELGQANLLSFFEWHPWLYLFLIPAISMRLWAEEKKTGTIELLTTFPLNIGAIVVGKFLASWVFCSLALILTFPLWLTVNYLGDPDNGVILSSYIGSILMAGGYLSIGSCISAMTNNQVVAFVISVTICFLFTVSGLPIVLDFFSAFSGQSFIDTVASFSFLSNYTKINKGLIDLRSLLFFITIMIFFIYMNIKIISNMSKQ